MSQRLPPLNALRTFEAAGRLQSIRGAAAELVVTPGAVSRQVRVLESWLGVSLFQHDGRTVRLTTKGEKYLAAVTEYLSAIAAATDELSDSNRRGAGLHLRSTTLFAANWLVPRLNGFHKHQPWVKLELTSSTQPSDFGRRDVDAEIRPSSRPWPGHSADWLLSNDIVCVCSPEFRAEHRLGKPRDLARLDTADILRSTAAPGLWQRWLDAAGVTGVDPERGSRFSDSVLTCQAAAAGQGVCLAPLMLVERDLAAGRLVVPFPLDTGPRMELYLVYPPDRLRRPAFRVFREWLLTEVHERSRSDAASLSS